MWKMIIPIVMIVLSNCIYHICSRSTPNGVNAFGTLMITYLVGTLLTGFIFLIIVKPENIVFELNKINWSSIVLGMAIVGLEAGYIYAYRVGWQVNTAPLVANTLLAVALIIIGALMFNEGISLKQGVGIVVCLVGMILINI